MVLGFAALGLYLFYFAYRYNLFYVSKSHIDTQGRAYICALQQITVGGYLLIVYLIGLFSIAVARNRIVLGPLIIMVIFLVFLSVYHISLNPILEALIKYLPRESEVPKPTSPIQECPADTYLLSHITTTTVACNEQIDNPFDVSGSPNWKRQCWNLVKYLCHDKSPDTETLRYLVSELWKSDHSPLQQDTPWKMWAVYSPAKLLIPSGTHKISKQFIHEIEGKAAMHNRNKPPVTIIHRMERLDSNNRIFLDGDCRSLQIYDPLTYVATH